MGQDVDEDCRSGVPDCFRILCCHDARALQRRGNGCAIILGAIAFRLRYSIGGIRCCDK